MTKIGRRHFFTGAAGVMLAGMNSVSGQAATSAKEQGFFLPEETEPHLRTFMQWPASRRVYQDRVFLRDVQATIADIANTISEFEPVVMLMHPDQGSVAQKQLSTQVEIWPIPTDDLWCRDSGPLFVIDGRGGLAVSHMNFNGWGGKQFHDNDGRVAMEVASELDLHLFDNGIVGEPGGVETDGQGTLIAHESSWVIDNRNKASRQEVERKLLNALGADKVIWAPGVAGADITDYHIDSLARFVAPGKVLIQLPEEPDPEDPWSLAAFETHDILAEATDARGRPLEIVVIPEPVRPRVSSMDFVASYVNYFVCNGGLIAPQFGDRRTDEEALDTLSRLYPNREVVQLNTDALGEIGGGVHCATQQQPKV